MHNRTLLTTVRTHVPEAAAASDEQSGAPANDEAGSSCGANARETPNPAQPRCDTYLRDMRSQLWATLERRNDLPVPVVDMAPSARAALIDDLLTKLYDV